MTQLKPKQCLQCGKLLTRGMFIDAYTWKRSKFCNMDCYQQYHAVKPRDCKVCGAAFMPATKTVKFCSKRCRYTASHRSGHRYIAGNGYMYIKVHSTTCPSGEYVLLHRWLMSQHIGRDLLDTEVVHHVNGNKTDNRIENLMLTKSHAEHFHYHVRGWHGWLKKGETITPRPCNGACSGLM